MVSGAGISLPTFPEIIEKEVVRYTPHDPTTVAFPRTRKETAHGPPDLGSLTLPQRSARFRKSLALKKEFQGHRESKTGDPDGVAYFKLSCLDLGELP